MDVVDDARARDPPEVPAGVESLWPHGLGKRGDSGGCKPVDLESLLGLELAEFALVAVGRDHQVTGCVRILVQDDERACSAVDYQPFLIVPVACATEDAPLLLVRALDVLEAPARPELLHGPLTASCASGRRRARPGRAQRSPIRPR